MRKNSSIWAIIIALSMLFLTVPNAVSVGGFDATITASASVTNSQVQPVKRVAILPNNGTTVDLNVFGSTPGKFQIFNHKNEWASVPVDRNNNWDYPAYLGTIDTEMGLIQRPDCVKYVVVQNNTSSSFGTYNVTVSTNVVGPVKMGKSIDIVANQHQTEVLLDIDKEGPVSISYYCANAILDYIRDPDGNIVSIFDEFYSTSAEVMRKNLFISAKKGIYSAYFIMTGDYSTLRLDYEKPKAYNIGEVIKHEDPIVPTGDLPNVAEAIVEIYEIKVKTGQAIRPYFKTLSRTQQVSLSYPSGEGHGYSFHSVNSSGNEPPIIIPKDGSAYFTIKRDQPSVYNAQPNTYIFALSDINVESISIDWVTRIRVQPLGVESTRVFFINLLSSGTLLFNHTVIQNDPDVGYTTYPSHFLKYIRNSTVRDLAPIMYTPMDSDHCYYHVRAGTYYFMISSTTPAGEGVVDMRISLFPDNEIDLTALSPNQPGLSQSQMQKFFLSNMQNNTAQYGATFLKVLKFSMPEFCLGTPLTVSIAATDNSGFFNHGTILGGTYAAKIFYESPYDGIYTVSSSYCESNFAIDSVGLHNDTFELEHEYIREGSFYLAFLVYNLRDGIDPSYIVQDDIIVSLGLGHRINELFTKNYDMSFNFAQNAVDPDEFKSYNEYVSLNASLIKGVIWKVTGAKQFDWIQINSQRLNGYNGDYKIKVFFNAPWYHYAISSDVMDYTDSWNNRVNRTLEFGAVNTTFYVYIEMTAADSSLNVDHKIWIGGYNVDVVRPEPLPGPEQDWLTIGLIIGGSVLAVVVVTVVIVVVRKKKRGY